MKEREAQRMAEDDRAEETHSWEGWFAPALGWHSSAGGGKPPFPTMRLLFLSCRLRLSALSLNK